uniref:uncharacterized protein LOC122591140 n=1 Tax=Erigeron canadensis TaxID=72917 RepID=UPI001CB9983C|nr:uncharacterized protein LOC122591140 [Erigeron canadensis]
MIEFGQKYGTNTVSSLDSLSQSKLRCNSVTEFTFCNVSITNDDELSNKDENPFVFSPSFKPKNGYSGYNCSSPATKAQNKILEMMKNLPESCHELSLNDIIVDDLQDARGKVEQKSDSKMGFKSKKTPKRKLPISRSVSLDTGVFMLKMFIPSSLSTRKSKSSSKMCSNKNSFSNNNNSIESSIKIKNTCTQTNTKSSCWMINKPWKLTSKRGCVF